MQSDTIQCEDCKYLGNLTADNIGFYASNTHCYSISNLQLSVSIPADE